jgi:hypothetical protein
MTTNLPSPDLSTSETASQLEDQLLSIPKTSAATQPSHDMKAADLSDDSDGFQTGTPETVSSSQMGKTPFDARTKMSSLLKGREKEWTAVAEKKGPLRLLDLPMDVLKEIVKEV